MVAVSIATPAQTSASLGDATEIWKLDLLLRRDVLKDFRIEGSVATVTEGTKLQLIHPSSHWDTYCQWTLLKGRATAAGVESARIVSAAGRELVSCR